MISWRISRGALVATVLTIVSSVKAIAQCPDGTPPPCRGAAPPAASRRPAPPLDDRTWIVVPFENVARVADIDWLKEASVNLLYLDMSRWRDIRVIDDERVADLIREVPEARGGTQLSLQSGIAVAKRAGAGRLVMGDLLKGGSRTKVVGKVFVRTGQRLRTVRQDAANADSIMGAFGQLARAVLDVAPPVGTSLGTIGTTSVGAYQAYLAGVGFLNRWLLDVEAWYNLGECSYHDLAVIPVAGDTTRYVYRSSWNTMLRAFRKSAGAGPDLPPWRFSTCRTRSWPRSGPGCRILPNETRCAPQSGGCPGPVSRRDLAAVVRARPGGTGVYLRGHALAPNVSTPGRPSRRAGSQGRGGPSVSPVRGHVGAR